MLEGLNIKFIRNFKINNAEFTVSSVFFPKLQINILQYKYFFRIFAKILIKKIYKIR